MIERRRLWFATLVVVLLFSANAFAQARMENNSPRAATVNAAEARRALAPQTNAVEKWSGTKAIIFDDATKTVRKPNAKEIADMVKTLRKLTAKPARRFAPTVTSDGAALRGGMEGANAMVIIARALPDGSMETRCVQSFDEATEWLGLVRDNGNSEN